jgi:uncharacterized repeat protein (TIGR01451 family)
VEIDIGGEIIVKHWNITLVSLIFILFAVLFSFSISPVVASSNDIVYVNCSSGNDNWDGSSWAKPKLSIKNATGTVKINGQVKIANGQYRGVNNTNIYLNKNMIITGQSQTKTIINGTDSEQIFMIMSGVNITIQNLMLTNGTSNDGGAIYNDGGNLIVKNSKLQDNHARYGGNDHGGAIYNDKGNLTITNSFFGDNSVRGNSDGSGGAIYSYYGNLTITNSSFENNEVEQSNREFGDADGGAICNDYGNLKILNCTINNNLANQVGGAICNLHGDITVINSILSYNNAESDHNAYGGAIYNGGGILTVRNSILNNNKIHGLYGSMGGAIYNYQANSTITNCTLNKNQAEMYGGAVYSYNSYLKLNNCTLNYNYDEEYGGAIYSQKGNLTVIDSIFKNNNANVAGGVIYINNVTALIKNCTLCNSTADYGGAIFNRASGLTVTESIINKNTAKIEGGAINNDGVCNLHYNRIIENTAKTGTVIYNWWYSRDPNTSMDANNNWWGSNIDPMNISNFIVVNGGVMKVDNWIILTVHANPKTIKNNKTSTVTADLNHINDGSLMVKEQIPDGLITLNIPWGSFKDNAITHTITKTTINGSLIIKYYANQGQAPKSPIEVSASSNGYTTKETESAYIKIDPVSNLYIRTLLDNYNPNVGEIFTLTYKLRNSGPDTAQSVTLTINLPAGLHILQTTGNGKWKYNTTTRTITWTLKNVEIGDTYLYITGWIVGPGQYIFSSLLGSDIYSISIDGVIPSNKSAEVNSATNTIGMQNTGIPINYLIMATFLLFFGLILPKRK